MDENKSYRIRTVVGTDKPDYVANLNVDLQQEYDTFEILSLKITSRDAYRLHDSNYGVIAGRVIANNGFGIPNAKISVFVEADSDDASELRHLYPYESTATKNDDGYKYNLLTDSKSDDCHQVVGTFPNKTYLLENDILLEVFEKYFKFTTRTNNSGDYMIVGVPVGTHTLHMDLDLSDCGILSQRPRDFVYKGYTIEQFESPNQFKTDKNLSSLSQIFTQDQVVTVNPFWGNATEGSVIGITRADINVSYKFEPTAVFMGSLVSDNSSNGISKRCVPTNRMGAMDELTSGEGSIEMIRKTPTGAVEAFTIKGNQQIDGNGIWCYQIPMNLDYVVTDEYGNMVPTDDPEKGIPTRTRVRFRISMTDMEGNTDTYFRAKVLVPNNPSVGEEIDYNFGTYTDEKSYRDLLWNNVYTVKSFIPRFERSTRWRTERFTGIKGVNHAGYNNPIPYNNLRIRLPLMFTMLCVLIKAYIWFIGVQNRLNIFLGDIYALFYEILVGLDIKIFGKHLFSKVVKNKNLVINKIKNITFTLIKEGLCPDLDGWYFAPITGKRKHRGGLPIYYIWLKKRDGISLLENTFLKIKDGNGDDDLNDEQSIDWINRESTKNTFCLTTNIDYLIECIEMALAEEYRVINFDFYNDWINGLIYIPRWMRTVKVKRRFLGIIGKKREKIKGCMDDNAIWGRTRKYMQLCSLRYAYNSVNSTYTDVKNDISNNNIQKYDGTNYIFIFGKEGGIVHEAKTLQNQNVYYLKPMEVRANKTRKVNLFATDLVLLGSLNSCDLNGIPNIFKYLSSTTYKLPTNLALTNMENDSQVYGGSGGTMCSGQILTEDNGVQPIEQTLSADYKFVNSSNAPYESEGFENGDTRAITEAAGISWGYAGPQQLINENIKKRKNRNYSINNMFYPGGHFLGLSCVNSQSNIKTCVNLSRACELGVTISQRHEKVRRINDRKGGTTEFKYTYNVPTGLIAQDEITSSDARAIFATMNHNKLIVSKVNGDTGYGTYDFTYLYPNGFNGEFENIFKRYKKIRDEYNKKISGSGNTDEDLSIYGINSASSNTDYDPEESENTQMQTIESVNKDYYRFRLGLGDKLGVSDRNKFAKSHRDGFSLPQYENSFYFYFGLKDGATAIDEFNKQFFATCESDSLIVKNVTDLQVSSTIDMCEGNEDIVVDLNGIESPLKLEVFKKDNKGEWESLKISGEATDDDGYFERIISSYEFKSDFNETYKFIVTDANGETLEKNYSSNDVPISLSTYVNGFNTLSVLERGKTFIANNRTSSIRTKSIQDITLDEFEPISSQSKRGIVLKDGSILDQNVTPYFRDEFIPVVDDNERDWMRGGYVTVNNLFIYDIDKNNFSDKFSSVKIGLSPLNGTVGKWYDYEEGLQIFASTPGDYTIWVNYKCNNGGGASLPVSNITIVAPQSVNLLMGDVDLNNVVKSPALYTTSWWENMEDNVEKEVDRWKLKHYMTQQNGISETSEVFDSQVRSEKGTKVLFGPAQGTDGSTSIAEWYDRGKNTYNSNSLDVPDGYVVTDENQEKKIWSVTSDGVSQGSQKMFASMAYFDASVGSEYFGYVSGATGNTLAITATSADVLNSMKGYGAIAKSVDGVIETVQIDNNGRAIFDEEKEEPYTGLFFPLIKYPSVYRPFYVDAIYVQRNMINVTKEENEWGGQYVVSDYEGKTVRVLGTIHNGITYYYHNGEYTFNSINICGKEVKNEYGFMEPTNIFKYTEKNISEAFRNGASVNTFTVYEGTPSSSAYTEMASVANAPDVDVTMYDDIAYGNGRLYTYGESNEDVKYYVINKEQIGVNERKALMAYGELNGTEVPLLVLKSNKNGSISYNIYIPLLNQYLYPFDCMRASVNEEGKVDWNILNECEEKIPIEVGETSKLEELISDTKLNESLFKQGYSMIPYFELDSNFKTYKNLLEETKTILKLDGTDKIDNVNSKAIIGVYRVEGDDSLDTATIIKVYSL